MGFREYQVMEAAVKKLNRRMSAENWEKWSPSYPGDPPRGGEVKGTVRPRAVSDLRNAPGGIEWVQIVRRSGGEIGGYGSGDGGWSVSERWEAVSPPPDAVTLMEELRMEFPAECRELEAAVAAYRADL